MPQLTPTKQFLEDLDCLKTNKPLWKKITKTLAFLKNNPLHPGLRIERIINDPTAWSVRVDKRMRISLDPEKLHPAGNPDWSAGILLLRVLDHDDLYLYPR